MMMGTNCFATIDNYNGRLNHSILILTTLFALPPEALALASFPDIVIPVFRVFSEKGSAQPPQADLPFCSSRLEPGLALHANDTTIHRICY